MSRSPFLAALALAGGCAPDCPIEPVVLEVTVDTSSGVIVSWDGGRASSVAAYRYVADDEMTVEQFFECPVAADGLPETCLSSPLVWGDPEGALGLEALDPSATWSVGVSRPDAERRCPDAEWGISEEFVPGADT